MIKVPVIKNYSLEVSWTLFLFLYYDLQGHDSHIWKCRANKRREKPHRDQHRGWCTLMSVSVYCTGNRKQIIYIGT